MLILVLPVETTSLVSPVERTPLMLHGKKVSLVSLAAWM